MELVIYFARRIYERLLKAFDIRDLESFFIPGYNLLGDSKYVQYQEQAMAYAWLIRQLLHVSL